MAVITPLDLTVTVWTGLYTAQVSDANINVSVSTAQGRTAAVFDFNNGDGLYSRDLGTIFQWPIASGTLLDVWQPSIIPLPETIYNRASDWMNGGTPAAKFIQGYSIEADSFNVPKTLSLQSGDDQTVHTLNEIPNGGIAFNKQTRKVFSCTPFVCHSLRRLSSDNVPWRVFDEEPIFQPYPELTLAWQNEPSSLGGVGWQHLREMNVTHLSTVAVTLTITPDNGPPIVIAIPSSGGVQKKVLIDQIPANKWKLLIFSFVSTAPFRLFLADLEMKVRSWGDPGPYRDIKPFGGPSSPAAEV